MYQYVLKVSERIREMSRNEGYELPLVTKEDLKDPMMMKILRQLNEDGDWAGKIVWGCKEAFAVGGIDGVWVDRWNFYMEDVSKEMDEKMEKQRIEALVKEMQELDLTDFYRFAERMRNGLMERGIELPPIPPEDEVRQILIRMAESGNLIKMSEPVDIHKAIKDDGNGNN
jgi:hypothetical protein